MSSKLAWPQSLRSAHALTELAQDIYCARCDYYGLDLVAPLWNELPNATRQQFMDLARQTLDLLQPETATQATAIPNGWTVIRNLDPLDPRD
jgi:hypothetical protein